MYKKLKGVLLTAIVTSNYQVRGRWGWTGFKNENWDQDVWPTLYPPRKSVDVNHWRGASISGYVLELAAYTAEDVSLRRGDWKRPRPLEYVVGTLLIPSVSYAGAWLLDRLHRREQVGISIEHVGRAPNKIIGPYVTLCDNPMNLDCWVAYVNGSRWPAPLLQDYRGTSVARNLRAHHGRCRASNRYTMEAWNAGNISHRRQA